jgi:hypothetical protein
MGVLILPWISKKDFNATPFNYCDHFGNKKALAQKCSICREEIEFTNDCLRKGLDPHDPNLLMKSVASNLGTATQMISEHAKEMGIDLDNLDDTEDPPNTDFLHEHWLYLAALEYQKRVSQMIQMFYPDYESYHHFLNALFHSQFYVPVKIMRALQSQLDDPEMRELTQDEKTSAFFAYIASLRNGLCAIKLAEHVKSRKSQKECQQFAQISFNLCRAIQTHFFPKESLDFEELGCDDYPIFYIP